MYQCPGKSSVASRPAMSSLRVVSTAVTGAGDSPRHAEAGPASALRLLHRLTSIFTNLDHTDSNLLCACASLSLLSIVSDEDISVGFRPLVLCSLVKE